MPICCSCSEMHLGCKRFRLRVVFFFLIRVGFLEVHHGSPFSWKVRGSSCRLWSCFAVGMILCLAWVWSFQLRSLKTFCQIPVPFCHNLIQWYIVAKPWNTSHLGHSLQSVVAVFDIIWYHIIFYIISYYFLLSNRPTSRRNWAMGNVQVAKMMTVGRLFFFRPRCPKRNWMNVRWVASYRRLPSCHFTTPSTRWECTWWLCTDVAQGFQHELGMGMSWSTCKVGRWDIFGRESLGIC